MLGIKILKKVSFEIGKRSSNVFKISFKEQKEYINSFTMPKDDIERSYYQYCCQMKLYGTFLHWCLNIASLPLIVWYFFKRCDDLIDKNSDAVFISEGVLSLKLLPETIVGIFSDIREAKQLNENLSISDKLFFKKIVRRYPFSWHFLFKSLLKIRVYSYLIQSYHPKVIIVCNEYSFTSSLLTAYCNRNNVLHYNVMHGEKLFFLRDTFFHYDKCFVWDEYYKNLFIELRAKEDQFQVYIPSTLCLGDGSVCKKEMDYTYYLGGQQGESLIKICKCMENLVFQGYKVAIRPHPFYTDINELEKIKGDNKFEIEYCSQLSISRSILRTKNVISLYSTVLNQAYHSKVNIIIDDITDLAAYNGLKSRKYIMLNKKHSLLSKIITT